MFAEARTNPPLVATPTGSAPYGAHFRRISARHFSALVPERRIVLERRAIVNFFYCLPRSSKATASRF